MHAGLNAAVKPHISSGGRNNAEQGMEHRGTDCDHTGDAAGHLASEGRS